MGTIILLVAVALLLLHLVTRVAGAPALRFRHSTVPQLIRGPRELIAQIRWATDAGMAGPIDTEEQDMLNGVFLDPAYSPPATRYIALSTTTPTETGSNFTEPSGSAYARVATTAADWGAATGSAPCTKSNTAVLTFPQATGSWGTVTHFGIFDAVSTGTVKWWGALTASKAIGNGDTASFAAAQITLQLGDPTDTY